MPFILEQSHSEIYASAGGLVVVGPIINRHSGLKKRLKSVPLRHGIALVDLVRTYLGLQCQGKNDFEAVEGIRDDIFFREALGIERVPFSARLRQRFDEQAVALTAADDWLVPLLSNLKAPISALPSGHIALHADVFCLDNGKTRKEGVSRTYHGYGGYAPIRAYLGEEGWCVGLELRPGEQHSQKDFAFFLDRVLPRTKALADKRVATFDETVQWTFEGKAHQARRVVRVTERTTDRHSQPLLLPALELEAWWTYLSADSIDAEALLRLYPRRGTSEQYHREFKTDLDLERVPSGKFDTNALVLALAVLAYNTLRYIGQDPLIGPDAPIRKAVHRRRLRKVLQEMIYKAARLIRHGRRTVLRFGRGDPGYAALARCYARVSCQ